jgi:hypothetical protein
MTKRRREVIEMMHSGWQLYVRASRTKNRRHKAFLVLQEGQLAPSRTVEVSFSVIDALQQAHLIHLVDSRCNQSTWIYELVERTSIRELAKKAELAPGELQDLTIKSLSESMGNLIIHQEDEATKVGGFDPKNIQDARERTVTSIVLRRGQSIFRKKLLEIYQGKCAISGTNVEQTLEAAHIIPYKGLNTNSPCNGLLLRADIHTLFDLGLIAIDTSKMTVILSEELAHTDYDQFMGRSLLFPADSSNRPSIEALNFHRQQSGL